MLWIESGARGRILREIPALLVRFALIIILGIAFIVLGDSVVEDGRQRFDDSAALFVHRHLGLGWLRLMKWSTGAASAPAAIAIMLVLCAWLLYRRQRKDALVIAVAWLGAQLLHVTLKQIYHRHRPALFTPLVHASGYSFPSGHTVTAVMTYGLLAAVMCPRLPKRWRWIPVAVAALIVVLVGLSRVYLGAHYPTDVLGSVLVAGAWLRASLLALDHVKRGERDHEAPASAPA